MELCIKKVSKVYNSRCVTPILKLCLYGEILMSKYKIFLELLFFL